MRIILILILIFSFSFTSNISKAEKIAIIKSQRLIEYGHFKKALKIINDALKKYPNNDKLLTLAGQALKESKELEKSLFFLQKALSINPDNQLAKALIKEIEETLEASENKVIRNALDWLTDKGVDFLMIFFGVLGGELLIKHLNKCEYRKDEDYIIDYVANNIDQNIKYSPTTILFKFQCNVVNILIYFTLISAIVVSILTIELLLELSFLKEIDEIGLWKHIFFLYIIVFLSLIIIKSFLKQDEKESDEEKIANILEQYLIDSKIFLLKKELKFLALLEKNDKINKIFDNILLEDNRVQIEKMLKKIKESNEN